MEFEQHQSPSRRSNVLAMNGLVATSQPLAAQAGLDILRRGGNELAIVVVRYSAQSYVEDQDQWWMAGLHRSVWLESRPVVHISDLPIEAGFDPLTGSGSVAATAGSVGVGDRGRLRRWSRGGLDRAGRAP